MRVAMIAIAMMTTAGPTACGLESDGSYKSGSSSDASTNTSAGAQSQLGRYRTEAIRLGVSRPLLLLIDTATGLVLQRDILGSERFRPVTEEPAPGADLETKVPGRYDVKVIPGRRGSALLRLDSATGKTWFVQLGASQRGWRTLPSSLDDEPKKLEVLSLTSPGNPTPPGGSQDTAPNARSEGEPPPIEAILNVLTGSGYETELRVWTASRMARLYPAAAAELLSTTLKSDDAKVMIAIIDGVQLGADGRVRAALELLRGHENPKVAKAIRKKLSASD